MRSRPFQKCKGNKRFLQNNSPRRAVAVPSNPVQVGGSGDRRARVAGGRGRVRTRSADGRTVVSGGQRSVGPDAGVDSLLRQALGDRSGLSRHQGHALRDGAVIDACVAPGAAGPPAVAQRRRGSGCHGSATERQPMDVRCSRMCRPVARFDLWTVIVAVLKEQKTNGVESHGDVHGVDATRGERCVRARLDGASSARVATSATLAAGGALIAHGSRTLRSSRLVGAAAPADPADVLEARTSRLPRRSPSAP